jgi:hypothetical protein
MNYDVFSFSVYRYVTMNNKPLPGAKHINKNLNQSTDKTRHGR